MTGFDLSRRQDCLKAIQFRAQLLGEEMNGADQQALIRMEGIKKVFLTDEVETHALSGIHLQINKGEYVSIAGPSGSGKSTLLAIVGLLDSPSDGEYTLKGTSVAN